MKFLSVCSLIFSFNAISQVYSVDVIPTDKLIAEIHVSNARIVYNLFEGDFRRLEESVVIMPGNGDGSHQRQYGVFCGTMYSQNQHPFFNLSQGQSAIVNNGKILVNCKRKLPTTSYGLKCSTVIDNDANFSYDMTVNAEVMKVGEMFQLIKVSSRGTGHNINCYPQQCQQTHQMSGTDDYNLSFKSLSSVQKFIVKNHCKNGTNETNETWRPSSELQQQ